MRAFPNCSSIRATASSSEFGMPGIPMPTRRATPRYIGYCATAKASRPNRSLREGEPVIASEPSSEEPGDPILIADERLSVAEESGDDLRGALGRWIEGSRIERWHINRLRIGIRYRCPESLPSEDKNDTVFLLVYKEELSVGADG